MLVVSYTILTKTLESKIQRDRQTFRPTHCASRWRRSRAERRDRRILPNLSAGREDLHRALSRSGGEKVASGDLFQPPAYRRDVHHDSGRPSDRFDCRTIRRGCWTIGSRDRGWPRARTAQEFYVSPVHPRSPDNRLATDLVSRNSADRMGRRSDSSASRSWSNASGVGFPRSIFADQAKCQIVDQNGAALFSDDFKANPDPISDSTNAL